MPERLRKPQYLVAAATGLVLALGVVIGSDLLQGDEPGSDSEGQEADAPLLFSNGEAVDERFETRHSGLVEQIHAELESRYGIGADQLYDPEDNPGGPRVVLTLDQSLQEAAEQAGSGAGVVAVEPGTGAVLCYYGAEDQTGSDQVGDAAPHPPASVFDMVTAAAALENGATVSSKWTTGSDDEVTLEAAVRESNRDAVAEVAAEYGTETIVDTAAELGVSAMGDQDGTVHDLSDEEIDYDAFEADGFGRYAVSVTDMAAVYATIAGDGLYADTHFIDRVVDSGGNAVEADEGIRTTQAISEETAAALQEVGLGHSDAIEERDYFGLPGTWPDEPPQSWYVGAIPQLSVAAWIGDADSAEDVDTAGVPVWRAVVDAAIDALDFPPESWDGGSGGGEEPSSDEPSDQESSEEPSEEPTTEEPSSEEPPESSDPPDDPTTEEPPDEPSTTRLEPSVEPTTDCGWICW